ncbi:type IV secretory system conjugative DNA transfer family protein [Saccharothrix obliqua]|uniref:type IV secretory system conjugative DNA transfer family protein n=1 Tax=Saccharothrix obliqua TaxID=2861747 RepID=UPI001C5F7C58|nr:TraM recognition domain-containing protein [Saccharothrix obliqua]MBW4722415.1 TraM recognition domain-containing protein [Saccharothrix obliqua]
MRTDKSVRWGQRKTTALGVAGLAGAYLLDTIGEDGSGIENALDYLVVPGYTAGGLAIAGAYAHRRWYFGEHQQLVRALGEDGWINQHDLRAAVGAAALYRNASYHRPELPARRSFRRHQVPTEYGFDLGGLVSGHTGRCWRHPLGRHGQHIYSPYGRGVRIIGRPGSGKSEYLTNLALDFPGAAVITSTKLELWEATAAVRGLLGPTWLFNPTGLGNVPSTFGWDPVSGCMNGEVAQARAEALVRGGGGAEGINRSDFWAKKGVEIIRCYLMAAALAGYDMGAVHYWATNFEDRTPVGILQAHPMHVPHGWVSTLESSMDASHNTRTGYIATVTSCVGFMDNPIVAAACRPRAADSFDVREFIAQRGTLYAVGSQNSTKLAPLLTALTEYIFDGIKRVAAEYVAPRNKHGEAIGKDGRLPLGAAMLMDEIAQQTPVELDKMAADSRGANITIAAVFQSEAQPRITWGPDGAQTIKESLPTKVFMGGIADPAARRETAALAGTRRVARTSEGESTHGKGIIKSRSRHTQTVEEPVMHENVLLGMPLGYAFVHGAYEGARGGVVRFELGHKRVAREKRRLRRALGDAPAREVELVDEHGLGAGVRA